MMDTLKGLINKEVKVHSALSNPIPNAFGRTQAIFFESVPYLRKNTTTFAYVGIPNAEKPQGGYPAIVLVHGGGGCAFYEWVEYWNRKGYVAIAFDCGGRQFGSCEHDGKGTAEVNPNGRHVNPDDNGSFGNDENSVCDSWTYHNVANIILANNILRANENVNKDKIVITGISWGGVLTAIASGIDDRFLAFAPVYGTGYLLESQIYTKYDRPNPKDYANWESIYDPKNYVCENKKPMLFTMGMNDHAFSPVNGQKTYGQTKGKIVYSYRYLLPHHHRWKDDEQMMHVVAFMDFYCKGTALPFEIISEKCANNQFAIQIKGADRVKKVRFNYTTSTDEDCMLWKWEQVEISGIDGKMHIEIPKGTKYCFYEVSNGEQVEYIVSSSIQNIGG